MTTPRPGHADLTGAIKYGYRDLRLPLERASARETTMRVAVGAVLQEAAGGVRHRDRRLRRADRRCGGRTCAMTTRSTDRIRDAEQSDVRCPDPAAAERMHDAIHQAKVDQDTLGGIIEVVALNVPPGLGLARPLRPPPRRADRRGDGQRPRHERRGDRSPRSPTRASTAREVHDQIGLGEGGSADADDQPRGRPGRRHHHRRADPRAGGDEADFDGHEVAGVGQSGDGRSRSRRPTSAATSAPCRAPCRSSKR